MKHWPETLLYRIPSTQRAGLFCGFFFFNEVITSGNFVLTIGCKKLYQYVLGLPKPRQYHLAWECKG